VRVHGHQVVGRSFLVEGEIMTRFRDGGCRLRCLLVQWQAKWKGAYTHKSIAAWVRILLTSFDSYVV
jgi:hypothetical protein